MKITVVGAGYVGLSNAILLSQKHTVNLLDIDEEKINKINLKISPICDSKIDEYLKTKKLNLVATTSAEVAFQDVDYIIIALPSNYSEKREQFDLSIIESVIKTIININNKTVIILKSTLPIGYTENLQKRYRDSGCTFMFYPEFLREGTALKDCLYPNRIVLGIAKNTLFTKAQEFINIVSGCITKKDVPIRIVSSTEAEAAKLFANAYLALRISFFNELDSYAEANNLSSEAIIDILGLDQRIGSYYNNPSFGYGGYCLPKDVKQLSVNYKHIPNGIISNIDKSNELRKDFIVSQIISKKPKVVGVYRLIMKKNSDNFRESSVVDIMNSLESNGIKIVVFEPLISNSIFNNCLVIKNLKEFKSVCDLIIANRYDNELSDVKNKLYTRDIYNIN